MIYFENLDESPFKKQELGVLEVEEVVVLEEGKERKWSEIHLSRGLLCLDGWMEGRKIKKL